MGTERKEKLKEWSLKLDALQGMLQEQERAFKQREGIATDLETVKFKRSEIEVIVFLFHAKYIYCLFSRYVISPSLVDENNRLSDSFVL